MLKSSKIYQKYHDLFFNDDYDIQHLLLNIILLTGFFGVTLSLIFQLVMDLDKTGSFFIFNLLIFLIVVIFIANTLKKPQLATVILAIVSNNIYMPILFLLSGGIQSGMPLWCFLGCMLSFLLLRGRKTFFIFTLNLLGFISALIISFYFPETVHYMDSTTDVILDIALGFVVVAFIISIVLRYNFKVYEKQRQQANQSMEIAKRADKAKSNFLSFMSHDIRTPMNTIMGYTEIAKRSIENKDINKIEECLSKIEISSNHLMQLLNDVLDMTKIEKGIISIEEENCSIKALIENACQILQKEFEEKNITLKTDYTMLDDDIVSCDKLRVNQILLNILSNAIKFSNTNGNVYITVVQLTGDDDSCIDTEIHIRDEGCGMMPSYLKKLFTPYERDKIHYTDNNSGTGLGLVITKSLVEIMNGKITVESEIDKGTEVIISIPFAVPSLEELKDEETEVFNFNGKKVLLVDDNDFHREIASVILSDLGLEIEEATDGRVAIEKLRMHQPKYYSLILMDIVMPVMDGYEATKEIRTVIDPELATIPIVAMTANAYADEKAKAFDAGMNAYLTKPLVSKDVARALKLILQ